MTTQVKPVSMLKETVEQKSAPLPTPVLLGLGIALIVLLVFGAVPSFDFVHYDDNLHVFRNPHLTPLTWRNVSYFWTHPYEQLYIPVSYMAYAALALIARRPSGGVSDTGALFDPHVFHTASLLVHVANVLMVFAILRRLTKADWPSAAGALLFGIHPLQVESVAWVSELRGQLSALFGFAAVYAYLGSVSKDRPFAWAALIWYTIGLLCKPGIVALPIVLIVLDQMVLGRSRGKALRLSSPPIVPALASIAVSRLVQAVWTEWLTPVWTRPLIALDSLAFYLWKLFWPINLVPDYSRTPSFVLTHHLEAVTWILPVSVGLMAWGLRRQFPEVGIGLLIALIAVLPESGLVPFGFQRISTIADRYMYLSMFGVAYAVAALLAKHRSRIVIGATALLLVLLGGLSTIQTQTWSNTTTLFEHNCAVNPQSFTAYINLGLGLYDRKLYDDAIAAYQKASSIDPTDPRPYMNIAGIFDEAGDKVDAAKELATVNTFHPGNRDILFRMANDYSSAGNYTQAVTYYQKCLAVDPQFAVAYNNLGIAYMYTGDKVDAVSAFRHAVALSPHEAGFVADLNHALSLTSSGSISAPVNEPR